jgi:hypothetical protein
MIFILPPPYQTLTHSLTLSLSLHKAIDNLLIDNGSDSSKSIFICEERSLKTMPLLEAFERMEEKEEEKEKKKNSGVSGRGSKE